MKTYLKTKDYAYSQQEFTLLYDEELEMLCTHPVPSDIEKYYESEGYISHTDASTSIKDRLYQWIKKYNLKRKEQLLRHYAPVNNTVLDIGAGTGSFVKYLQQKGWAAEGVEPNPNARSIAAEKGLALHASPDQFQDRAFGSITLWHVLEHLPDLKAQIRKINSLLDKQGIVFVAVPNYRSYDAKHYGKYWAAYDVPRHLWHFSENSVKMLFEREGLKYMNRHPMVFDAFYIALLSEKYKTGKANFVKALWLGLRSNLQARRNGQYSALLYVFKKP